MGENTPASSAPPTPLPMAPAAYRTEGDIRRPLWAAKLEPKRDPPLPPTPPRPRLAERCCCCCCCCLWMLREAKSVGAAAAFFAVADATDEPLEAAAEGAWSEDAWRRAGLKRSGAVAALLMLAAAVVEGEAGRPSREGVVASRCWGLASSAATAGEAAARWWAESPRRCAFCGDRNADELPPPPRNGAVFALRWRLVPKRRLCCCDSPEWWGGAIAAPSKLVAWEEGRGGLRRTAGVGFAITGVPR